MITKNVMVTLAGRPNVGKSTLKRTGWRKNLHRVQ